jgi:L-iditol 2-dehydrogenase
MRFCSSAKTFPHLDGTLQQTLNHPASVLFPLPDSVSYEQAALAEPLSVILHAARRAQLSAGQTVFVFGVGAIGLLACALSRQLGATKIVAVDINDDRLNFALEQGFVDHIWCLPRGERSKTPEEALKKAKELMQTALSKFDEQDGFDVVFECTGVEPCIQMAVHVSPIPRTSFKLMLMQARRRQ